MTTALSVIAPVGDDPVDWPVVRTLRRFAMRVHPATHNCPERSISVDLVRVTDEDSHSTEVHIYGGTEVLTLAEAAELAALLHQALASA